MAHEVQALRTVRSSDGTAIAFERTYVGLSLPTVDAHPGSSHRRAFLVSQGTPRGSPSADLQVRTQSRLTANTRHCPGTPFNVCDPRSSNSMPEPATRSFTVPDTKTWSASARAATRAPMWTAMPRPGLP